jgi:acylaminoacyl-peptidase
VLATPPGSITEVGSTPDGLVHYLWSRAGTPPRPLVAAPGRAAPAVPGGPVPHHRELWTRQPYGRIHTLLATPPDRPGPWPLLFLVHGGPATHDRDEYDPRVEAFTGAGYAVARVNYRGSTGYGPAWQRTDPHRVGLDQLDDLAAVRRHLLALGVATPDRTGLCGWSWGGYLTLLAMGAQPRLWSVGMAVSPVADYVAAYRATTPALREVDRELFGGDPEQVPARYRSASPMTYVDGVREPVLVVAGADDEKCPLPQVRGYTGALRARGVPHRLELVGGGHQPRDAAGLAAVLSNMLRYARDAMTGPRPEPAGNGRR